jgi:hypothetical protein
MQKIHLKKAESRVKMTKGTSDEKPEVAFDQL